MSDEENLRYTKNLQPVWLAGSWEEPMIAYFEALRIKQEKVAGLTRVLRAYPNIPRKFFLRKHLEEAAEEMKYLEHGDEASRRKLYLGMFKYALVWYDFPNAPMRMIRDTDQFNV